MKQHVLIMAGGEGKRAGDELPKQFHKLLGIPMLWWSVIAFNKENPKTEISVVMHPGFFDEFDLLRKELPDEIRNIPVNLIAGGKNRGHSVKNGLMHIPDSEKILVAVHDAARPLITPEIISVAWKQAETYGNAVPVVPVTDSLRHLSADESHAVDRSEFVVVQTPQTFRADILKAAYLLEDKPEFTDDASRVEALGEKIILFESKPINIKITNPIDFAIAETLLKTL